MDQLLNLIKSAYIKMLNGNLDNAKSEFAAKFPFNPMSRQGDPTVSMRMSIEVFMRDRFTCRYCGTRTIMPGVMRMLSICIPDVFPYQPNWKSDETHQAYWIISSSCDHLLPASRGGPTDEGNLRTSCYMCNARKANFTLEELEWQEKPIDTASDWDGLSGYFIRLYEIHKPDITELKNIYNNFRRLNYPLGVWEKR